jgi:nitrate/TMAO reductase-like tetraheme cytochrome c subunit
VEGTDHDMRVTAPGAKNLAGRTAEQDGVCSACHIIHNGFNEIRLWSRKWGPSFIQDWNKNLGAEGDKAIQFCTSCHSDGEPGQAKQPKRGLHPYPFLVGVRRAADSQWNPPYRPLKYVYKTLSTFMTDRMMDDMVRPAYPPYNDKGELDMDTGDLTCPTCHNLHKWYPKYFKKGPGKNEEGWVNTSFLRKDVVYEFCIDCHSYDALYRTKYFHTPRAREKLAPLTKFDQIRMMVDKAQKRSK